VLSGIEAGWPYRRGGRLNCGPLFGKKFTECVSRLKASASRDCRCSKSCIIDHCFIVTETCSEAFSRSPRRSAKLLSRHRSQQGADAPGRRGADRLVPSPNCASTALPDVAVRVGAALVNKAHANRAPPLPRDDSERKTPAANTTSSAGRPNTPPARGLPPPTRAQSDDLRCVIVLQTKEHQKPYCFRRQNLFHPARAGRGQINPKKNRSTPAIPLLFRRCN